MRRFIDKYGLTLCRVGLFYALVFDYNMEEPHPHTLSPFTVYIVIAMYHFTAKASEEKKLAEVKGAT